MEQGFLLPETLSPPSSRSKAKILHVVAALEQYFDLLHDSGARKSGSKFAGAEKEGQRLASRALAFLKLVSCIFPISAYPLSQDLQRYLDLTYLG